MNFSKLPSKTTTNLVTVSDRAPYDVGYGKPPEVTRFKPGKSGNPKGRPKGKRNKAPPAATQHERLKSIILEEAYRNVKVNDGPALVKIPMAQAVMRSIAVTAAKGNTRAQKVFTTLLSETESSNKKADDEWLQTMIEYKTNWEMELQRRTHHGIIGVADPLPHPDDVIVDYRRNTIIIHGPMDKRERADLDLWLTRRHDNEAELQYFKNVINDQKNSPYLSQFQQEIAYTERILEIINTGLSLRASQNCIERRFAQLDLKTPDYLVKLERLEQMR